MWTVIGSHNGRNISGYNLNITAREYVVYLSVGLVGRKAEPLTVEKLCCIEKTFSYEIKDR